MRNSFGVFTRFLLVILLVVELFWPSNFAFASPTNPTNGETITAGLDSTYGANGYSDPLGISNVQLALQVISGTNTVLYCWDHNKTMFGYGETLKWNGKYIEDAGLVYILQNGYPNKKPVSNGSNAVNHRITQYAIWIYRDRYMGASKIEDSKENAALNHATYGKYIKALVDGAVSAKNTKPSISLDNISLNAINKEYFETNLFTASGNNFSTWTLSYTAPAGTTVYDSSNNKITNMSINKGTKVKLRVPASAVTSSSTLNIKAQATATGGKLYLYDSVVSTIQDGVIPTIVATSTSLSANKSATFPKPSVKISKTDVTGKKEVVGAHLVVKEKDGDKVIDEWDSTEQIHEISGDKFVNGKKYILSETTAPKGYQISTDIEFTYNVTGMDVINMSDEASVDVIISKQSVTGSKELEGAKLVIKDKETGTVIDEWTSGKAPHTISGAKFDDGKEYVLIETIAPKGYNVSSDITFTYNAKKMDPIVMKDEAIVENPNTGLDNPLLLCGLSIIMVGFGLYTLNKKNKFIKI